MKLVLVLALSFSLSTSAYAYSDAEANTRLGRHLTTIADDARTGRLVAGITFLTLGAAGGVGYFVANDSTSASTRDMAPVLGIFGGLFLVGGTIALLVRGDEETFAEEFQAIPAGDLKAKVGTGEDMLRKLASRAKRERLIGGGISVALGLAEVIWYAAEPTSALGSDRSWLLYNGVLLMGLGGLNFFLRRTAEDEHDAYREWRGETRTAWHPRIGVVNTLGVPTPALGWTF
jgi:hypothetical protein